MKRFPETIKPMLAVSASEPFDSKEHLFEIKWDGYRAVAFLDKEVGSTRLQSRNLRDLSQRYMSLGNLHGRVKGAKRVILDGEIVALKEGVPKFQDLQKGTASVVYVAFDILWKDDMSLMDIPLLERKGLLESAMEQGGSSILSSYVLHKGRALYEAVGKARLEGIVAKSVTGPYLAGKRSRHWLKVKWRRSLDCVILGYSETPGKEVASLALGLVDEGHLRYVGRVGSGIRLEESRCLADKLSAIRVDKRMVSDSGYDLSNIKWVIPLLVCEVEYLELTASGYLRHPVYKGLRKDKEPFECLIEEGQ